MRKSLWILVLSVLVIGTGNVSAKTPDGQTPSRETVCDNETGAAYGLCNAYCEAMDCTDPNQRASNQGCESVKANFEKKTGRPLPCAMTCPCPGLLQLFNDIVSGAVIVTRCIADDDLLFLRTINGDAAFIEDGPPANCNVNNDPGQTVELTETERLVCRVRLRQAVEAMGVQCTRSE
jgi:hypothetical protein